MGLCEISSVYFLVDLICGLFLSLAATIGRHNRSGRIRIFSIVRADGNIHVYRWTKMRCKYILMEDYYRIRIFRFDKKRHYCIHPAVMCLRWMANNHRISFALFQSPTNQGLGVHMDGQ